MLIFISQGKTLSLSPLGPMVLTVSAMLKSSTPKFPEIQRKILAISPYENQKQVTYIHFTMGQSKHFYSKKKEGMGPKPE